MAKKEKTIKRKKLKKKVPIVRICLKANFNNSIITLTDLEGKVITWASSGKVGFKGSRKSTPFASQRATEQIMEICQEIGASTAHQISIWTQLINQKDIFC